MLPEYSDFNIWTGWPARPILTLYGDGGRILVRSCSKRFDLADAIGHHYAEDPLVLLFGIRSNSSSTHRWAAEALAVQENNIRYDLSEDGYDVEFVRLKGLGLACAEEALWQLVITT